MVAVMIPVGLSANDPVFELEVGKGCNPINVSGTMFTAFSGNRDSVLASLSSDLTPQLYASNNDGNIYALAVCMKYLTSRQCSKCITGAVTQLKAYCSRSLGGRIYLDGCFVRYEDSSFDGQAVDAGNSSNCLYSTNSSDPRFSERAQALSTQLITNASANNNYAVGSINGSLYGLAQCWPSLSNNSCQTCLNDTRNLLLECTPMSEGRGLEAGCFMRYSTYMFYNQTSHSGNSSSKLVTKLSVSIGGAVLVAVVCFVLLCRRSRQWKSCSRPDDNLTAVKESFEVFDYEVLKNSTGNFKRNNVIGRGGFGEVYKGRVPDGREVAIKKLNGRHQTTEAAQEFLTEARLISSARHRNLVRLFGCCTRGHERLLVYEFMSNNSLDKHLFGEIRNPLSWENRLKIIEGTARGLAYLHEDANERIIHRDIKCANILLDERFHPKIADFGMARFFPYDQTHVSTSRFGGTRGYAAPEYAVHGQLSEKADVYSYGIVVLEIVSGRKCLDYRLPEPVQILLQWAWNKYEQDEALDIVDSTVEGQYSREQVLKIISIAFLCTQGSSTRPAMSHVLRMLNNDGDIPVQPTQPDFIDTATTSKPTNSNATSNSESSAPDPSHGSITVSLCPR